MLGWVSHTTLLSFVCAFSVLHRSRVDRLLESAEGDVGLQVDHLPDRAPGFLSCCLGAACLPCMLLCSCYTVDQVCAQREGPFSCSPFVLVEWRRVAPTLLLLRIPLLRSFFGVDGLCVCVPACAVDPFLLVCYYVHIHLISHMCVCVCLCFLFLSLLFTSSAGVCVSNLCSIPHVVHVPGNCHSSIHVCVCVCVFVWPASSNPWQCVVSCL